VYVFSKPSLDNLLTKLIQGDSLDATLSMELMKETIAKKILIFSRIFIAMRTLSIWTVSHREPIVF
jgi:hypothetical protein